MIRFYNGKILSFDDVSCRISEGECWVDGDVISYVGPKPDEMPGFEREIDLGGNLLMPGFKNSHAHTAMTFLRSLADDKPLHRWLNESVFPNEAKLTDEAVYNFARIGIMEYLTSGITSCFDMYFHNEAYTAAVIDSGYRSVICASLNDFDKDPENIEREYLKYNGLNDRLSYILGLHAEYTTCVERMEYLSSLAGKYGSPCFVHLSETKAEVEGCIERHGMTPPQYLDSIGFFDYGGGGYHCVWFNDEDIALFAEKGLYAVTCPASNMKLASGVAPVEKMRKAGIRLAIGTDGAASNNALDMFREMYLVSVLQKNLLGDASACPADEVLRMACVNGADMIGLSCCNNLAVGKKADLIVLDLSRPNMQPEHNTVKNIVYSGSKENVLLTMVNGKVLYEKGEFFIGEDPQSIYAKAKEFVSTL